MTENQCACGKPSKDATLCPACAHALDAAVASVSEHHGLAWDLSIASSKQARIGDRNGSRPTETAVPFDQRAADTASELYRVLHRWAHLIHYETGHTAPPSDLAGIAGWLRRRVGWMRYHHQGGEAHAQITQAVRQARRVIDRPAERLYAGPCDCGQDLYARPEAAYATCRNTDCGAVWDVADRRRWLLEAVEDLLASTIEISRALTRYAQPVTPNMIYGYVHRQMLTARGHRFEGHREIPLYRVGDVLDILARQAANVA